MSGPRIWDEYAEALGNLARAPEAARRRREQISAQEQHERQTPDDRLRAAVQAEEQLEERLRRLDALIRQTMHDRDIESEGPVADVDLPTPASVPDAHAVIDRIEDQLRSDVDSLETARQLAKERRERLRQLALMAAGGVAVLVAVIVVTIFFG